MSIASTCRRVYILCSSSRDVSQWDCFRVTNEQTVYSLVALLLQIMNVTELTTFDTFPLSEESNFTDESIVPSKTAHDNSKDLINSIHFYLLGFIIPSGIVCNAFCLFVCTLSIGLRRTTTGHYLMALASADLLFLVADLARWMNTTSPQEKRQVFDCYFDSSKQ